MQACKNTYDKKTNKVANELNKLGIGKKNKTKKNITGKKATLPTRDSFSRCKRGGRGEREGCFWGGGRREKGVAVGFNKKKHSET